MRLNKKSSPELSLFVPYTAHIRQHALKFDTQVFNAQIISFVEQAYHAFREKRAFIWENPVPIVL